MLALLTAVVLTSTSPSAANLAGHFVRVQEAPPAEQPRGYEQWTREQLLDERYRLDVARPSLVMPIVLVAAGGGAIVIGGVSLLYAGMLSLLASVLGGRAGIDTGVVIVCAVTDPR